MAIWARESVRDVAGKGIGANVAKRLGKSRQTSETRLTKIATLVELAVAKLAIGGKKSVERARPHFLNGRRGFFAPSTRYQNEDEASEEESAEWQKAFFEVAADVDAEGIWEVEFFKCELVISFERENPARVEADGQPERGRCVAGVAEDEADEKEGGKGVKHWQRLEEFLTNESEHFEACLPVGGVLHRAACGWREEVDDGENERE